MALWLLYMRFLFLSRGIWDKPHLLKDLFNAALGTDYSDEKFISDIGKDVIKHERMFNIAAGVVEEWIPEWMRVKPLEPHGDVSDIPESEYDSFWDESYWGEFPPMPCRIAKLDL